jgi:hypothetical protein
MNCRAAAQKGREEVSLHGEAMIRIPREIVEPAHGPLRIMAGPPISLLIGETGDILEIAMASDRIEQS